MVKVCPKCGYSNPDFAMYCGSCGYPLAQPPSTVQQPLYTRQPPSLDKVIISSMKKGANSFAKGLGLLLLGFLLGYAYLNAPSFLRLLIFFIFAMIGSILLMYDGQKRTRKGLKALSTLGFRYTEGAVGSILLFLWIFLLVLESLITGIATVVHSYTLALIPLALIVILPLFFAVGGILISIAYLRNGGLYSSGMIRAGGIVILVASVVYLLTYLFGSGGIENVVISITSFILAIIGFAIVDKGYANLLKAPNLPVKQSLPYQPSYSTIFPDGSAQINVYSPYQARVIKAEILGTNITTFDITPNTLNMGYNNLIMKFNLIQGLTPNATYTVQLYLDNGQILSAQAVYL